MNYLKQYLNLLLAGFPVPNQLYGLLNITDDSHILYGSDYPYAFPNFIQSQKEKLDKTKLLTQKQKKKVYKDNFELLFNLETSFDMPNCFFDKIDPEHKCKGTRTKNYAKFLHIISNKLAFANV